MRLGHAVELVEQRGAGQTLPYIALEHVVSNTGQLVDSGLPTRTAGDGEVLVESGDVLYGKLRPYLNKVVYVSRRAATSTELLALRAHRDLESRYLYYLILSRQFLSFGNSASYGVKMPRTSWELVRMFQIEPPKPKMQCRIADFLDRETERIDALMDKKRRLIDLLEEKRTATITHAVTKGLDPTAPMKPTNIPWIGDIPEHWRVTTLGRVVLLQGGYAFSSEHFAPEGVAVVRINNLSRGRLDLSSAMHIDPTLVPEGISLGIGDLLVGMTGSLDNWAVVGATDLPAALNQRVGRVTSSNPDLIFYPFATWMMQSTSVRLQIRLAATGTAQLNVSSEGIEATWVALPPLDEQIEVVERLSRQTAYIANTTDRIVPQLRLLAEYREALITAAVTGEIDVDTFDTNRTMEETTA